MYKVFSFLVAFALAFPFLSFAHDCNDDSLKELKGTYAYQISGEFGPLSLSNFLTETGVFKANGKGRISAQAFAVVDGQTTNTVTYEDGTYTVNNHIATIRATRISSDGTTQNLTFVLSIAEKTDTVFIQLLPNSLPGSLVNFANVKGTGAK